MKSLIGMMFFSILLLIVIPYTHSPSENKGGKYNRYKEEYVHNLKNPPLKRYREISCIVHKEVSNQEKVGEEQRCNCCL